MNSSYQYNTAGQQQQLTNNAVALPQHLTNLGTRVNSQNRIISPTSSCNQYPHLKAENSVFNTSNAKRSTQYGAGPSNVIPVSYGGNVS